MAASLTLIRSATVHGSSTRSLNGGSDPKDATLTGSTPLTVSGAKVWRGRVSLAAAGTQTLDLTALAQLDTAGDTVETINFATVYSIDVANVSENTAAIATIGNSGATGFYNTSGGLGAAASTRSVAADKVPVNIAYLSTGMTTTAKKDLLITAGAGGALLLDVIITGA